METLTLVLLGLTLAAALAALVLLGLTLRRLHRLRPERLSDRVADEVTERSALLLRGLKHELLTENRASRREASQTVQSTMRTVSETLSGSVNQQFRTFSAQNAAALEGIQRTVETRLEAMLGEEAQDIWAMTYECFYELWLEDPERAYIHLLKTRFFLSSAEIKDFLEVSSTANVDQIFSRNIKFLRETWARRDNLKTLGRMPVKQRPPKKPPAHG